jgi:anti-sigma B factor antagonist
MRTSHSVITYSSARKKLQNRSGGRVLSLEVQNSSEIMVVRCSGRIVQGSGTDELLRAVMSQDCRHIQIDLSRVKAIDAGGLGVLVTLERWARDGNRKIQLLNPSKRVRDALETTRLSSVLDISPQRGRHQAA